MISISDREKFLALVKRAQELDARCKENSANMEQLKQELADFKKSVGGGKTKKKGFWDSLLGDESDDNESEDS